VARLHPADFVRVTLGPGAVLDRILTSLGNDTRLPKGRKAIRPGEVKAQRNNKLTPEQIHAIRGRLGLK